MKILGAANGRCLKTRTWMYCAVRCPLTRSTKLCRQTYRAGGRIFDVESATLSRFACPRHFAEVPVVIPFVVPGVAPGVVPGAVPVGAVAGVVVATVVAAPGVGIVRQVTPPERCTQGIELVGSTTSEPGTRRFVVGIQQPTMKSAASGMTLRIVPPCVPIEQPEMVVSLLVAPLGLEPRLS